MKNISIALIFLCFCFTYSQTQSLADAIVAGQKGTIQGYLSTELALKIRQRNLMRDLRKEEDTYADKRGALGNISNSMAYLSIGLMMSSMETKITEIEHNIFVVKVARFGIFHGLKGYETDLDKEKKYFFKLKQEYAILNQCMLVSGGSGYNYTAFLKLLLRTMEIRQNLFLINREVKKLMYVSKLLAK